MNNNCPICEAAAHSRPIAVRGGKPMTLWHCPSCDFDFFTHDPTPGLAADKLDQTRLRSAGLDIPTVQRDFSNGLRQSTPCIDEYMDASDRGRNILEVGCSWGYFLKLARDAGAIPYGVEINAVRSSYVNDELRIQCDTRLEECEKRGIRFKKIFMVYVLEYVPQPVQYIQRLVNLLDNDGKLILITPSLRDPLKDLWKNTGFANFFYDEHAINYFSPLAVNRLIKRLHAGKTYVSTRQGYSFVNHVSWFLTGAPRTTGVVGGDNFIADIVTQLKTPPENCADAAANNLRTAAALRLAEMIQDFDVSYRQYLESQQLGNQIRLIICK